MKHLSKFGEKKNRFLVLLAGSFSLQPESCFPLQSLLFLPTTAWSTSQEKQSWEDTWNVWFRFCNWKVEPQERLVWYKSTRVGFEDPCNWLAPATEVPVAANLYPANWLPHFQCSFGTRISLLCYNFFSFLREISDKKVTSNERSSIQSFADNKASMSN